MSEMKTIQEESRRKSGPLSAVVGCALLLLSAGCTNDGAAYSTLAASGYTEIKLTGWSPLSCSDSDGTCTGFEAKGPTGQRVEGAVGCGYFMKGCTIRITGTR